MPTKHKPKSPKKRLSSQTAHTHPSNKPTTPTASAPVISAVVAEQRRLVSAQEVERATGLKAHTLYKMCRERLVGCYRRGVKKRGLLFDLQEVLASLHQPALTAPTTPTGEAAKVTAGDE